MVKWLCFITASLLVAASIAGFFIWKNAQDNTRTNCIFVKK